MGRLDLLPHPLPHILSHDEIMPTMHRMIDDHRSLVDSLIATVKVSDASFDNVVRPIVELENAQSGRHAIIDALKYCSPSQECQDKVEEAQDLWGRYMSRPRETLFWLIKAAKDKVDGSKEGAGIADTESRKVLDRMLVEFEEYGFGILSGQEIAQRAARMQKIEKLSAEFDRNLRQSQTGELFAPEEMDGLPARDRKPPNADGMEMYDSRQHMTIMRTVHSADTRRKMMEAHYRRHSENIPIFRDIILLRDINAREVGSASHAATRLPYRVAESVQWVEDLINSVSEVLVPLGRAQYERVAEMKNRHEGPYERTLEAWDYLYYSNMLNTDTSPADAADMSEYFPLMHTMNSMVGLFGSLVQLQFERIPDHLLQDWVWHPSVFGWYVWDNRAKTRGDFVGYLFADVIAREYKYRGNQSVNLQPGYQNADGTRTYPGNTIMCGFDLTPGTECLLRHHQVVTLFHELGHSIHDLVSRTRYARWHGYQVPLELGEGIGRMLEEWCWIPSVLKNLSRHYTRIKPEYMADWLRDHPGADVPPETIPQAHIEQRLKSRGREKTFRILGMLIPAVFDLQVHNQASHEDLVELDEAALYRKIFEKFKFRRLPEGTHPHTADGLITSGYDAGYYSYICAEVLAADFFQTAFARDPFSEDAWGRFRETILEPGGSGNELEMIESFLGGRPCDAKALLSMVRDPVS